MGRWTRDELEQAFDKFQAACLKGGKTGDFREWADCFTEDVTYIEHHHGKFWGRERAYEWISATTGEFPSNHLDSFAISWYSIDEEKGWIIFEVLNRMSDLGDGKIYEAPVLIILRYAGNGLFNYEEDVYNPANMEAMMAEWLAAKEAIDGASGSNSAD